MTSRFQIDQASVTDNEVARQVEFVAEVDGDEHDFAVKYSMLKELSGDDPEDDALEMFERFSDEIEDACVDAINKRPTANVIVVDESDLQ